MSSDNPYGPNQPEPWGQGGPASGPSGSPYGYPPPAGPPQPPGAAGSGYAFGPFAPQPGPGPGTTAPGPTVPGPGPGPGAAPPPPGRGRGVLILGVAALALVLVAIGAAVLVRNRGAAGPDPTATSTAGSGPAPSGSPSAASAPPAGGLASDAVAGYLEALAAGDADRALGYAAAPVPAGKFMTDAVLAASVKRAPITGIDVPEVADPAASSVSATYTIGKTPVTTDYGVRQVNGTWKLTAVHRTVDLSLVRSPSIPLLLNGVKVTSSSVDVLPGTYAFTTESPLLSLGARAVMTIQHPNDFASALDLRVGLSTAGRKTVVDQARKSYRQCLRSRNTRPRNCPFSWTNSEQRYRQGALRWRQLGADPFTKPSVTVIERSARIGIPLRVRISGPCTFSGTSGTCTGNVTGRGVASIRLDRSPLKVVWLT